MSSFALSDTENARTAVIGLGGAGHNVLNIIASHDVTPDCSLYAAHLDMRLLKASKTQNRILLGERSTHGLGSGGDPEVGALAANASKQELAKAIEGKELVIIIAGLGGGTGSGAAPIIAQIAKEQHAFVTAIVVSPFSFEGTRRKQQAEKALKALHDNADMVLHLENDRVQHLIEGENQVVQVFEASNGILAGAVQTIHSIAHHPGFFHIGLDDLKAVTSRGNCLFGIGKASGPDRGTKAAEQVARCPLFTKQIDHIDGNDILIQFNGPDSLTIKEIEEAIGIISRHLPDDAQIHFGISVRQDLDDTVEIMVFASESTAKQQESKPEQIEAPTPSAAPIIVTAAPVIPADTRQEEATETVGEEQRDEPTNEIEDVFATPSEQNVLFEQEPETQQPEPIKERPLIIESENDPDVDQPDEDEPTTPILTPSDTEQIIREVKDTREENVEEKAEESLPIFSSNPVPAMQEFDFGLGEPQEPEKELREDTEETIEDQPPAFTSIPEISPEPENNDPEPQAEEPKQYVPQYDSPSFKGLFSDDNPFIVNGEDLDLPPSMRKKRDTLL